MTQHHPTPLALLLTTLLVAACATAPDAREQDRDHDHDSALADAHGAETSGQSSLRPRSTLIAVDESEEGKALDHMADDYRRAVEKLYVGMGSDFNACYLPELKRDPNLKGSFVVEFTVVSGGSIGDGPTITDNSIRNPKVESCVLRLVQRVKYPEPYNDEYATVKRLFRFGAF